MSRSRKGTGDPVSRPRAAATSATTVPMPSARHRSRAVPVPVVGFGKLHAKRCSTPFYRATHSAAPRPDEKKPSRIVVRAFQCRTAPACGRLRAGRMMRVEGVPSNAVVLGGKLAMRCQRRRAGDPRRGAGCHRSEEGGGGGCVRLRARSPEGDGCGHACLPVGRRRRQRASPENHLAHWCAGVCVCALVPGRWRAVS